MLILWYFKFLMDFLERFRDNEEKSKLAIDDRYKALVGWITEHKAENLEELKEASGKEDFSIELAWVKIPDPRPETANPVEIEVLPVLTVEWCEQDDNRDKDLVLDVSSLMIVGKLPSGEESVIGHMSVYPDKGIATHMMSPSLVLYSEAKRPESTRWDSADAELFLNVAEAALEQQPLGQ